MPFIPGTVALTGIVAPTDASDIFPVIDPQYGIDGLRNVATIQEMLAIPKPRRRLGMIVGVNVSSTSATYYYLASDGGGTTTLESDWKVFQTGGSIVFFDEGNNLGSFAKVKFVGNDVSASRDPNDTTLLNVFIPSPTFASHYNLSDGAASGAVSESNIGRVIARISEPTSEAVPFRTNGWENTEQSATSSSSVTFTTANPVTGQGGDATLTVEVYNAANTVIATFTTPVTANNGPSGVSSTGSNAGITVTITGFTDDASKKKANIAVNVNVATVFSNVSETGGRYYVKITNKTDSLTDGGGLYTYTQTQVFYDANPTPAAPGFQLGSANTTIDESTNPNLILTKHISGVEYYTLNSSFRINSPGIIGVNGNSQGRLPGSGSTNAAIENFSMSASETYGINDILQKVWAPTGTNQFTGWTSKWNHPATTYENVDARIGKTNHRYRGPNAKATIRLFDPWANGAVKDSNPLKAILVDTFPTTGNSTSDVEEFDDEEYRLQSNYITPWNSNSTLVAGDACIVGSCLVKPNRFFLTDPTTSAVQPNLTSYLPNKGGPNPDYTLLSGDSRYYRKFFVGNNRAISSFQLVFSGTFLSNSVSTDLANGDLQIFVRRIASATPANPSGPGAPALLLHGALYDDILFNDGVSNGQIRLFQSNATSVFATFGSYDALQGILMEIVIRNNAIRIDRIAFVPSQA